MNNDIIRLLPDSVANQIAAGEVIQRPASVIKELVENAVDAGATAITIILKDAGRTLIQVVDDGCGMSPTDARMAFERHATSKIKAAEDLFNLHTMGFRGEALPSVAAVAQIDLRTMRHGDSIGTRLLISESKFESQEPATCVPGTNLMVKNLFFHMPARRKFLKKDSIEMGHVMREFERLALVNTDIDFTLIHNDMTMHQFRRSSLKQRIGALFGKNVESALAPVATETSLVKIDGFIGMPRAAKKRGAQQFFFVNGRNMRHPLFHKVVMRCYEHLIAPDAMPSYFINFQVDPSAIDVNIHPQKNEVKFEQESAICQILEASVRETLGKTQAAGALDFAGDEAPDIPLFDPAVSPVNPDEPFDENFNPFNMQPDDVPSFNGSWQDLSAGSVEQANPVHSTVKHAPQDWQKLYDNFNRERSEAYSEGGFRPASDNLPDSTPAAVGEGLFEASDMADDVQPQDFFQFRNSYIVMGSRSGVMLISQRRAHIRILFERYLGALEEGAVASQNLLFAEEVNLSPSQSAVLEANMRSFNSFGFSFTRGDSDRWCVSAVPAPMCGTNPVQVILAMLDEMADTEDVTPQQILSPLALAMAQASAVRESQPLSKTEIDALIADLFRCAEPSYTPDGLPVMSIVGNDEIVSRFSSLQ